MVYGSGYSVGLFATGCCKVQAVPPDKPARLRDPDVHTRKTGDSDSSPAAASPSQSQVLEPGTSRNPLHPHLHSLFCNFVVEGTFRSLLSQHFSNSLVDVGSKYSKPYANQRAACIKERFPD
eukprot:1161311-Pelagomonas_calceolata.AAC.25